MQRSAWLGTGATCELDVVDAQCTFGKSRRAAQSKLTSELMGKADQTACKSS